MIGRLGPRGRSGPALTGLPAAGLVIALYLTWTKLVGEVPACGPLRGCETVATSPYSDFLGLPVALYGAGASALVTLAGLRWWWRGDRVALQLAYVLGLVSVVALAYLTYLELFVIGAICVWCVAYSVLVAAAWVASVVASRRA